MPKITAVICLFLTKGLPISINKHLLNIKNTDKKNFFLIKKTKLIILIFYFMSGKIMNSKKLRFVILFLIMPLLLLLSLKFLMNNVDKIEKEQNDYTKINISKENPLAKNKTFEELISNPDLSNALEKHLYDYDKAMNMSESSVWYKPLSGLNYDMAFEQSLSEKNKINDANEFKKIKEKYNTLGVIDSLSEESIGVGDLLDYLNKYYLYGFNDGKVAARKIYSTYINKMNPEMKINKIDLTNGSQTPNDNTKVKNVPVSLDVLFTQYSANTTLKKAVQISYNCYGNTDCYDSAANTLNFNQKVFLLVFIELSNQDKNVQLSQKEIESKTTKSMFKYLNNDAAKKAIILTGFMEGYTKSM